MKRLSFAVHVGVFIVALTAFFGGATSAVLTDKVDGAPSSLETVYGEGFILDDVTGIFTNDNLYNFYGGGMHLMSFHGGELSSC